MSDEQVGADVEVTSRRSRRRWRRPALLGPTASKVGAGFVAGALLVTMTTGITYAATSSTGAKACESAKGALALLSAHGKCPAHDRKVTLGARGLKGARGPQGIQGVKGNTGAQGPGAVLTEAQSDAASVEADGKAVPLAGTDLKAYVSCKPGGLAAFGFSGMSASDTIYVHGTVQVAASTFDDVAYADNTQPDINDKYLSNGFNLITRESIGSVSLDAPYLTVNQADSADSGYVDLLVNVGSTNTAPNPSFAVTGWLTESASHCQADVQLTPASAPTS